MDEVFGNGGPKTEASGYKNEIIWCYSIGGKATGKFAEKHDTIFLYSKTPNFIFNSERARIPRKPNSHMRVRIDPDGREYQAKIDKKTGKEYIYYLDEGKIAEDYWTDIETINREDAQRTGYPTQKPEKLLERIIGSCSNLDSIVFDFFMGSGTTQAVAMKLGRRFIGADINLGAVQTTTKRLLKVADELSKQQPKLGEEAPTYYTGFEVYNVNNYDVFRNPVQAKELLLEALEINKFPASDLFDGELDGRLVKIMPVNRIATRADLNDLTSGFDYAEFGRRKAEHPSRPVEKITLVCMGHESDLAAQLQKEVGDYKLDIQVVDILRDRQDLQFKRDSEAEIVIDNGELIIRQFYPLNLMQKLSLQQENVTDWREMVESVMIDWNYDGAVITEPEVDIPEKNALVKGRYKVPQGAGNIRVKITDLLSESLEQDVSNG